MSYYIDIDTMWRGVGPAGKLIRIVWTFAAASLSDRKVVFSPNTCKWWNITLEPYDNPNCNIEQKSKENNPLRVLEGLCPDSSRRKKISQKFAQQLLIPNSKIRDRVYQIRKSVGEQYICVHIRGTDKILERLYLPPILHCRLLDKALESNDLKVIVATDSEYFFQWFVKKYPFAVGTGSLRSVNETPLHLHQPTCKHEKMFEDCMVDFFIIAGASQLIYTPSMMTTLCSLVVPTVKKASVESLIGPKERELLTDATEYIRHLYKKWTVAARKTGHDFL